jgi:hypothetical protein
MKELVARIYAHGRGLRFEKYSNAILAIAAIGVAVVTFIRVFQMAVDVPIWDEWEWSRTILAYRGGTLAFPLLWAQHNEHRMLFPQLMMLFLDSFGFWSQRRECLFSVVVVTGSLWLLWRTARHTLQLRSALIVTMIGSLLLFDPAQSENWLQGFQTAWFLVDFAVFGAALLLAQTKAGPALILGAAGLAALAAYSSGPGLAIIPAVAVGLFVRRRALGYAPLMQWTVASMVIIGIYFWGWSPTADSMAPSLSALVSRVVAMAAVAGLPFGLGSGAIASTTLGAVGLILSAMFVVPIVREGDAAKLARATPWIVILTYGVVSSALIGYGRAANPESTRYITCSLMLWIGLAGVIALHPPLTVLPTIWVRIAAGLGAFVLICYFTGTWFFGVQALSTAAAYYRRSNSILTNYQQAPDSDLATLYPVPAFLRAQIPALVSIGQLPEIR